jgi:rare lipoprotein A (peptidoglycan hydrolase)
MPLINGRFYMNPTYGRAVERAREAATSSSEGPGEHWVTINGHHVLIHEKNGQQPKVQQAGKDVSQARPSETLKTNSLPSSGVASIYADKFQGRKTANGETFDQDGYSAALLPRTRWHALRMGAHVELTHNGKSVVVEINDRGEGDKNPDSARTLDLSRAAAAALTGQDIMDDEDSRKVGLISLDKIKVVSRSTPLGPVSHQS